ncbi:hypothetical protein D3C84_940740 [compost metagenome]
MVRGSTLRFCFTPFTSIESGTVSRYPAIFSSHLFSEAITSEGGAKARAVNNPDFFKKSRRDAFDSSSVNLSLVDFLAAIPGIFKLEKIKNVIPNKFNNPTQ